MGKIPDRAFWELLKPKEVGTPVRVGEAWASRKASATVAEKDEATGRWYFTGEEVAIRVWPNRFLEAPFGEGALIWMGLEVKTDRREWRGKDLVFALEPFGLNWYGHGRFRPALQDSGKRLGQLRRAMAAGRSMAEALEAMTHDPFETSAKWLTARLKNPRRLHWEGLEPLGDQFAFGRSRNYSYVSKPAAWLFGVCEDCDRAVREVRAEILEDPKLVARVPFEPLEVADAAIEASVRQALAGREGGSRRERVAWRALRIMAQHMDNAAFRKGSRPRRGTVGLPGREVRKEDSERRRREAEGDLLGE